ncbi:MAG: hydroxysqualene dehydroxylase HpnE [Ignavibacteriae bacterium]|nr:hydroxysqualene dehydroxylase HpnE [Ignavibacteriota bacterium]
MKPGKAVTIIGGGIAGLSAAIFLNERGFRIKLLETSPKLGGRAYSFFDKEKDQFFDNGQHILAGWYTNTFEYLKITGSFNKLNIQKNLEVNFFNTDREVFKLKCPDMTPPMNLITGLLKFKAFNFKDKFALKNISSLLKDTGKISDSFENTGLLLKNLNQTGNLLKYFWEPFILAVFNTTPDKVSTEIFLTVMNIGFNSKNNSTLVIPEVNLNELLINDAVNYFRENKIEVVLNSRVERIITNEDEKKIDCVLTENGDKFNSDYFISAVPFFGFKKLFDENIYLKNNFKSEFLKTSSIVSVHLFLENEITEEILPANSLGMTGLIGTTVQWLFIRNRKHLSLVISGADDLLVTEMSQDEILELCLNDLKKTIPGFDKIKISGHKIIKEKRATFVPDKTSKELRPKHETSYSNFFIAGDWTDTGLPATIESAVTSAKKCASLITNYELGITSFER